MENILGNQDDRIKIEQITDQMKIGSISEQIKEISQKSSDVTKKLQENNLSVQDEKNLSAELDMLVKKGSELGKEKRRLQDALFLTNAQ